LSPGERDLADRQGDKGTAGTMVAPAGEFKPRTSAKVHFGLAMHIYTEPAAPATETVTSDSRLQPVCICNECVDLCVEIIGKQQKAAAASETNKSVAEAAPPADDGLGIPTFLLRATS
jgi:hypothetical protein